MLHAPQPVDLAFEAFLKELPPEYATMACEFKAFARPRKLKTPAQLLQIVMLYSRLEERITETAIHPRLRACGPGLKALLQATLPATATPLSTLRLPIVEGSSRQGPGAAGTDDRVHLALDLTQMTVHAVDVTGADGGETLARDPWQAGDSVLVDRGYHQPRVILDRFARGVGVSVRLNPTAMPGRVRSGGGAVGGRGVSARLHGRHDPSPGVAARAAGERTGLVVRGASTAGGCGGRPAAMPNNGSTPRANPE